MLLLAPLYNYINNKMLANTPYNWSESLLQLPIDSIIKHVQEHNSLVPDPNITIALKLYKELLNPIKAILVISNLSYKKSSLDFLKVLHLLLRVSLAKLGSILVIHLLMERELLDIDDDL